MAATINDVARVAGVSISTVSYALSGKRPIGEKTRQRIESAILELQYQPNAGARALAGRRTYILAVTEPLRPDTYTPAHMAFVLAAATAARAYDYDVLLLTQDEATGGLHRVTSSRLVDGVIVLDVLAEDERAELVRSLDVPAALVGIPADTDGLVCVDLDFEAAARLAVDRLADGGHRVVGLLGHPPSVYARGSNFPLRFREAFVTHAAERDLEVRLGAPERTIAGVREAVAEILGPDRDLTGLVMHCEDTIQMRTLDVLCAAGLRVPQDVSVISAASTFDTSTFAPPLDVIPLIPAESCSRAVELTIAQITGTVEPRVELIPPTYVDRGSTAPRRP
ncbi:LacI family DNA-binding transcriptional regulator [Actinotalea sp. BY-33]|uniref:LacI family DNA-binding transcriptional regulator n=1 Tax=Actinotalea soli TaxID=2819234 RepID=A0A939RTV1_9CELL|nr:LacI family DNA-binding transcriptional regulator [Actinotalea soli]MBO1751779.1 LacI family DNA-binding transcriptional regulator [Actinotalea soli]